MVKPAKFDWQQIPKKKKKYAPQFSRSTYKKNFSPIGPRMAEKKGENLFLSLRKLVSRKTQIKKLEEKVAFFVLYVWICADSEIVRVVSHGESESGVGFK